MIIISAPPVINTITFPRQVLPVRAGQPLTQPLLAIPQDRPFTATVIEGGNDKVLLEIAGQRVLAETSSPVKTGQQLHILASETSSRIILKVFSDPLQARLAHSIHAFGSKWSESPLAKHLTNENSPLFRSLSPDARQAVTNWLSYLRDPATNPFKGADFLKLPQDLGLTLEKNLATGQKDTALSLKSALLDAISSLRVGETKLSKNVLQQIRQSIGEQSQLFKQLDPIAREAISNWLGAREAASPLSFKAADINQLARQLGLFQPSSQSQKIQAGDLSTLMKNAVFNSAQTLQESGGLAKQIGAQLQHLAGNPSATGAPAELRDAATTWMSILGQVSAQQPSGIGGSTGEPFTQDALTQLARILGITSENAAKGESIEKILLNAAGELQQNKGIVARQTGIILQGLLEGGGTFIKNLEPDARMALHAMLAHVQNPVVAPPIQDGDLRLLAQLMGLKSEFFSKAGDSDARSAVERTLQQALQQLQTGKGVTLNDISRQLQQLELFQLSQVKLDQQNMYFLPLPLPFLEQGYLIAEENGSPSDRPDQKNLTISLYLSMQNLGDMRVDFHQHTDGLFIRFAYDSQTKAAFAESFRPELEEALASFSVKGIVFEAGAEPPATAIIRKMIGDEESILDTKI